MEQEERTMEQAPEQTPRYQRPGWFTRRVMGPALNALMRLGISIRGSRILEHRGRRSGEPRRIPVNLLHLGGRDYLVAARGETQWVRNVRAADGRLTLLLGRHRDERRATELSPDDAVPVLRAYLARWKFEVGMFFDGITPDATDEEWAAVAAKHPVFEIR